MKWVRYLWMIAKHKYWVMVYAVKLGCTWRGIWHDISKLGPSEFIAHADYFCGNGDGDKTELDKAWLNHIRRNRHHPEWFCVMKDKQQIRLEMPMQYRLEMCADWQARAYHRDNLSLPEFYEKTGKHLPFAPETRAWVEKKVEEL